MTKKRVPVKNIDPVLVDVKRPGFNYRNRIKLVRLNLTKIPPKIKTEPRTYKTYKTILRWGTVLVSLTLITVSLLTLLNLKQIKAVILRGGEQVVKNFISSVDALKNFRTDEAGPILRKNTEELGRLNVVLEKPTARTFVGLLGGVIPAFRDVGVFLSQLAELNLNFLKLSEIISDLQKNGFYYFQNDGGVLLSRLSQIRSLISDVNDRIELMKNTTAELKNFSPVFNNADQLISEQYLKYRSDLKNLDSFLAGLLQIFGSVEEKHILLIFHNPAEIRPAGGFIGSYGDLVVREGQMIGLEVQDIYWPDHPMNFKLKVIPPEPLQAIVTDWAARDANWFFDFPTSARTVISFLENSKIYKEKNIHFEGAIAINIRVMETILDFIGPVNIEEYGLVVNSDNFLLEIQREVETGRDKKPGQNPKRILSVLTPLILEKLNTLGGEEQKKLFDNLKNHFAKKDIMIFAKDSSLATFLSSLNVDGAVYKLPTSFWGSYLAVVNANIAGGKSDAFVDEMVEVRSDIDTDGGIFSDITITRSHKGDTQKDPWWRATNQNFIQIFTNPESTIVALTGNDLKRYARPTYNKDEYIVNADLEKIESTKVFLAEHNAWSMSAFGKTVFATWWNIPAGKSETLNIRYQTPSSNQSLPAPGKKFRFIFERQSGVKNSLKLNIGAPLGYKWVESANPIFIYENDDPNARIILDLTLTK